MELPEKVNIASISLIALLSLYVMIGVYSVMGFSNTLSSIFKGISQGNEVIFNIGALLIPFLFVLSAIYLFMAIKHFNNHGKRNQLITYASWINFIVLGISISWSLSIIFKPSSWYLFALNEIIILQSVTFIGMLVSFALFLKGRK
ncbi:hypothetical protein FJZ18_01045 [Candidatus Pacearchaeota archaeon]|nr:hypothetical protein [Candidatus Pacearchaeota archaeon]